MAPAPGEEVQGSRNGCMRATRHPREGGDPAQRKTSRRASMARTETLHPAPQRRVTLTDHAKGGPTPFPVRGPSNRKRPYGLRQPPPPGPSTRTGNVQLYLSESRRTPIWMSGPLGGFGGGVKDVRSENTQTRHQPQIDKCCLAAYAADDRSSARRPNPVPG